MNKRIFHRVVALAKNCISEWIMTAFPKNYGFVHLYLLLCLELSQNGNSRTADKPGTHVFVGRHDKEREKIYTQHVHENLGIRKT